MPRLDSHDQDVVRPERLPFQHAPSYGGTDEVAVRQRRLVRRLQVGAQQVPPTDGDLGEVVDDVLNRLLVVEDHDGRIPDFPVTPLTPTGVMAIRCKQFHLPDL